MTTVINTPQPTSDQGNGMGMIVGFVVLIVFGLLFFVYGLPALRNMKFGGTEVNIPDKIDVNVNQTN